MKYVSINNLQPGDVVADRVCDSTGRILLEKNTALTRFYIQKLKGLNFPGIYVDSELGIDIAVEDFIPISLKRETMESLYKLDITDTIDNAKRIVSYIFDKKDISLDYLDTRGEDNKIFEHSIAVAQNSVVIGKALGFNQESLVDLAVAGLLHDVGKLFGDKKLAQKASLDFSKIEGDYEEQKHPIYAYQLLKDEIDLKSTTKAAIVFHHVDENMIKNMVVKDIHVFAKIVNIANAYDNIRYRDGNINPALAVEYLKSNSGIKFNSEIVNKFLDFAPLFPVGITVFLSTGELAIVLNQNKGFPERPKIVIVSGENKGMKIDLLDRENLNIVINGSELENINQREMKVR